MSRHTVMHEAQHVRMIQQGDAAYAVHRRVSFDLPRDEITWELMWMAEGTIDEFRAERGVHERGFGAPVNDAAAEDVADIIDAFRSTWTTYQSGQNLMSAYQGATLSLERLANHLAYGAALVVTGKTTPSQWVQVPAMGRMVDILEGLPSADVTIPDEQLVDRAVWLAKRLRHMLQEHGFDLYYTSDGSTWLEVK